ncbi:hypothetical protein THO17_13540 [Marinomonas sp. THO17]
MSGVRYALLQSVFFIVVLILASWFLQQQITSQTRQDIDEELEFYAQDLKESFTLSNGMPNWYAQDEQIPIENRFDAFRSYQSKVYGTVKSAVFNQTGFFTMNDEALFDARYLRWLKSGTEQGLNSMLVLQHEATKEDYQHLNRWRVYVTDVVGGKIAVYMPIDEAEDVLDLIPVIVWPIGVLLILVSIIGGCLFGAFQQRRLTKISQGLSKIAQGNLAIRLAPEKCQDDLDDLMASIDSTTEKLDQSIQHIKHHAQHFAHELRTPLTHLKNELEMLSPTLDLDRVSKKVDDIIEIFNVIQRISRLTNRQIAPADEFIALNNVIESVADLYQETLEEEGKLLHVQLFSHVTIRADRQMLIQAVSNLLENANRYAGDEAEIWLTAEDNEIRVEDNGSGIPLDLLDKVQLPLFRRSHNSQGQGLGLALVKAITEFHRADLILQESQYGGLCVRILFKEGVNKSSEHQS